ncbi:hypothetical protein OF83DRAFT_25132 [Amylostereum chailletii]|nr:hypothetical protein OF83DRAFT_25132 [Amylostereum chailletii]
MARPSTASTSKSASSSSSESLPGALREKLVGSQKVHYQSQRDWDFVVNSDDEPIDLTLILPHYRAYNQPTGHRMSMYIHSQRGEVKSKICRSSPRSPFFLSVHSSGLVPVTLYLPSDFNGTIRFPVRQPKVSCSAGFNNHILPRVHFSSSTRHGSTEYDADEVEIYASGPVQLRMWDVAEGAPERSAREVIRQMYRRASSKNLRVEAKSQTHPQVIDWDFLLDD